MRTDAGEATQLCQCELHPDDRPFLDHLPEDEDDGNDPASHVAARAETGGEGEQDVLVHVELCGGEAGGANGRDRIVDNGQGDHHRADEGEGFRDPRLIWAKEPQEDAREDESGGDEEQRQAAAHFRF